MTKDSVLDLISRHVVVLEHLLKLGKLVLPRGRSHGGERHVTSAVRLLGLSKQLSRYLRSLVLPVAVPGLAKHQLLCGRRAHLAWSGMAHVAWIFPPVGEGFAKLLASFTVTCAPVQACLKRLVCLCIGVHSGPNAYDY